MGNQAGRCFVPEEYEEDPLSPKSQFNRQFTPQVMGHEEALLMSRLSSEPELSAWDSKRFTLLHPLQDAVRNRGTVALYQDLSSGSFAAVKKMPSSWVEAGPTEFDRKHGNSKERPWLDIGVTAFLTEQGYKFSCRFLGIFCDSKSTYMVSSFGGKDLFSWASDCQAVSLQRECMVQPIAVQLFSAICDLHALGIAHRDLSLENVLVEDTPDGPHLRLIDFGAATLRRECFGGKAVGKNVYAAPETYREQVYDSFLADSFSAGVLVFGMTLKDFLWDSTAPGQDEAFARAESLGMKAILDEFKMSTGLRELLLGLLALDPAFRLSVSKRPSGANASIWDSAWLASFGLVADGNTLANHA